MPTSQSRHGCDVFESAGSQHLVIYGGVTTTTFPIIPISTSGIQSIAFLKMSDLSKGWFQIPLVQLKVVNKSITGGLVTRLTESFWDMMFIDSGFILTMCNGNYTWSTTKIAPASNREIVFAPIGASNLSPCVRKYPFLSILFKMAPAEKHCKSLN